MFDFLKNRLFRKGIFLVLIAACAIGVYRMSKQTTTIHSQGVMFSTMNTVATIQLYSEDPARIEQGFNVVQDTFREVETLCNPYNPESELAKLNANASKHAVICSPELWDLLAHARKFYQISKGGFDVTITPLMRLWGFHRKVGQIPSEQEIANAKDLVGLDQVLFDESARSVRFPKDGMSIDLGGIAKGWALDRAAERLAKIGIQRGTIDLGGNVRALKQAPPNRKFYQAGVRDPFQKNQYFATTELLNAAIATSGSYERFSVINGKQYSHIINPKTGYPVENMISVTIVAEDGVTSDALSTSIFVNGPDFMKEIFARFPGIRILALARSSTQQDKIDMTKSPGWEILFAPAVEAEADYRKHEGQPDSGH